MGVRARVATEAGSDWSARGGRRGVAFHLADGVFRERGSDGDRDGNGGGDSEGSGSAATASATGGSGGFCDVWSSEWAAAGDGNGGRAVVAGSSRRRTRGRRPWREQHGRVSATTGGYSGDSTVQQPRGVARCFVGARCFGVAPGGFGSVRGVGVVWWGWVVRVLSRLPWARVVRAEPCWCASAGSSRGRQTASQGVDGEHSSPGVVPFGPRPVPSTAARWAGIASVVLWG